MDHHFFYQRETFPVSSIRVLEKIIPRRKIAIAVSFAFSGIEKKTAQFPFKLSLNLYYNGAYFWFLTFRTEILQHNY